MFFDPSRRVNGGCDRGRKAEATKIIEQTSQSDTVSGRKGFLERGRDLGSIWEAVQHPSKMLSDVTGTVGGPELSDNLTGGGSSPKNFPHFVKHSSFFRLHLILSVFHLPSRIEPRRRSKAKLLLCRNRQSPSGTNIARISLQGSNPIFRSFPVKLRGKI